MIVYFKKQANRKKEIDFFDFLKRDFKDLIHIDQNYLLDYSLLNNFISIPEVINSLKNDNSLAKSKRERSIQELSKLPNKVYVAKTINDVSVDFTIVLNNKIYFIEFHEKQHSQLSVSRLTPIFCSKFERFEIPRFTQRLLKDIWRLENLSNYKIVWWDWFEKNKNNVNAMDLIHTKITEFYIPGKFNFSDF